jgi:hypothetical protein
MIKLSFHKDVSKFARFDIIKCLKILHHNVEEMDGEYYVTKNMIFYEGESIGYDQNSFLINFLKTFKSPFVVSLTPSLDQYITIFKHCSLVETKPIYFVGDCNFQKIHEYNHPHQRILLTTNISLQDVQDLIDNKVRIWFVGTDLPHYLQKFYDMTIVSTARDMGYFIYNHYFSLST